MKAKEFIESALLFIVLAFGALLSLFSRGGRIDDGNDNND